MAFALTRCSTPFTCIHRTDSRPARASPSSSRRACVTRAAGNEPEQTTTDNSAQQPAPPAQPYTRTFKALGMDVIESSESFPEPEKDIWSSDTFNLLGKLSSNFFIIAAVLGLVVGGFAARSFNDGATVFIQPADGPDSQPKVYFQGDLEKLQ